MNPPPSAPLPGFESIKRSWSEEHGRYGARILPGEFYVTRADEVIMTLLGSCVSACIRDPRTGAGGMNHFMLPQVGEDSSTPWLKQASTRYGNYAMERMINELLKGGARREELEAKLVGGGRMYNSEGNIGRQNVDFARAYLAEEGIRIWAEDVGGDWPRRVQFIPREGRMRVLRLPPIAARTIGDHERKYQRSLEAEPVTGTIELF